MTDDDEARAEENRASLDCVDCGKTLYGEDFAEAQAEYDTHVKDEHNRQHRTR